MGVVINLNKSLSFAKKNVNGCTFLSAYTAANGDQKIKAVLKIKGKKEEVFIPKNGSLPGGFNNMTTADIVELMNALNEYKSNKESL